MKTQKINPKSRRESVAETIRTRIRSAGERYWRLSDFPSLPSGAVAQTLSRLARAGELQRVSKGLYWRPRQTAFGPSRPKPELARSSLLKGRRVYPAGVSAANLLGFTTQNAARLEVATDEIRLPKGAFEQGTIIHTRRPGAWRSLSQEEAALLDLLRNRAESSELPPKRTIEKLLDYLRDGERFEKLLAVAGDEPPRVRAMLGALGQQLGYSPKELASLLDNLNPLSKFDFGMLSALEYAREWQAKECKGHETL